MASSGWGSGFAATAPGRCRKPRGRHPNNDHGIVVDQDLLSDHAGIRPKGSPSIDGSAPPPDGRCRRGHPLPAKTPARAPARSPAPGSSSETNSPVDALRLVSQADRKRCVVAAEDRTRRPAPAARNPVHRVRRRPGTWLLPSWPGGPDHLQLLGVRHGKAPKHQLIEQREDGRVGAMPSANDSTATTVKAGLRERRCKA